jgi:phosphate transport system substrate-binding protein
MRHLVFKIIIANLLLIGNLHARDQIRAAGSSTVFPFITIAAEEFGRNSKYKTPIIEATGTGGGFKLFCSGVGTKFTDISNASREIKASEVKLCSKNGVKEITEIKLGFDGIVLANTNQSKKYRLTTKEIFLALAKDIPANGKIIKNKYNKWSDINPNLPNVAIQIYGPPPTSGTRDAFVELVMQKSCVKLPEFVKAYPNKKQRKKICSLIREDGKFIEAGENDNIIVQKLLKNPNALGLFGYSFLEQNSDNVQGSIVNNVEPTFENIADGAYPISRSLFIYIKNAHYKIVKGLREFAREIVSEESMGEEGYLVMRGLIPLSEEEFAEMHQRVN